MKPLNAGHRRNIKSSRSFATVPALALSMGYTSGEFEMSSVFQPIVVALRGLV